MAISSTTLGPDMGATDQNISPGNDSLLGGAGNDTLYGGAGNDTVDGLTNNDVVFGNSGVDVVHGNSGDDSVYGGRGDDTVYGDLGDDRVSGDRGNDLLYGGAGADKFAFGAGYGQDWIGDFNGEQGDRILLAPGTQFRIVSFQGQVQLDLGNGDVIGLVGQGTFNADYVTYG